MKNYLLTCCLSLLALMVSAHQPDISMTMLAEQKDGSWILQVRSSLTAFEYEIETHYGKGAYTTPEEFRDLVICHLEENISIAFGEQLKAVLYNGFVQLGHETIVVFQVAGVPEPMNAITVTNSSFSQINSNQSALIILKNGFEKKQFNLNAKNSHTVYLQAINNAFHLQSLQ